MVELRIAKEIPDSPGWESSTNDTKLAAVLQTFRIELHPICPCEWCDVWPSRSAYLAYQNNSSHFPPKPQGYFNFVVDKTTYDQLEAACKDENAEMAFESSLAQLPEQQQQAIKNAHSRALARACQEALEYREELVKFIRSMPPDTRWDVVMGTYPWQKAKFGKCANPELKAEFLNSL
jgi:hypothetical protein